MKTINAKTSQETSLSFSRRYFNWRNKAEDEDNDEAILTYEASSHSFSGVSQLERQQGVLMSFKSKPVTFNSALQAPPRKKLPKLRSALALFGKSRSGASSSLGSKLIGTLFGYRRGHVHIAFQEDPKSSPAFMIQISTPTSVLVKEMASGMVRVAFECEKKAEMKRVKLLDEPLWRAYCNGKKCGYATRQECGLQELKVLAAVGPITMGAGVIPDEEDDGVGEEGELMYMRARFERVAGSKDSENFYMINPDGNGGPELSLYFLRV